MSGTPTHNKDGFPVVPCDRCAGRERMEEFGHVANGECFKCGGDRVVVKPGKTARAYKAYKAAAVAAQVATVADLTEGDTFRFGINTVDRWKKFEGITEDTLNEGYLNVQTNHGVVTVKGVDFPVRIHRPGAVDVNEYLKGL